jgi:hypothetical protein
MTESTFNPHCPTPNGCCNNCYKKYINPIINQYRKTIIELITNIKNELIEQIFVCDIYVELQTIITLHINRYKTIHNLANQMNSIFLQLNLQHNIALSSHEHKLIDLLVLLYSYYGDTKQIYKIKHACKYLDINTFSGLPLMLYIMNTNLIKVKEVIELGADVHIRNAGSIFYAFKTRNLAVTLYLLSLGISCKTIFTELLGEKDGNSIIENCTTLLTKGNQNANFNINCEIICDLYRFTEKHPTLQIDEYMLKLYNVNVVQKLFVLDTGKDIIKEAQKYVERRAELDQIILNLCEHLDVD